jgi:hypothetical protein
MEQHVAEGADLVERGGRLFRDQEQQGLGQRDDRVADHRPEQRAERQVRHDHEQRVPAVDAPRMAFHGRDPPPAAGGGLGVPGDRVRHGQHPVPGRPGPPAQVEVVAEQREPGVEPAQPLPHVAADQHARGRHVEGVADAVVLALVVLPRLEPGVAASRPVDGHPDFEQYAPVEPVAQLRAEDSRARVLLGDAEQRLQGVDVRRAVVVQQPDPLSALVCARKALEDRVHRLTEAGGPGQRHDVPGAEDLAEQLAAAVPAAVVDAHHPVDGAGLAERRVERLLEPAGAVMGDDDRGDRVHGGPWGVCTACAEHPIREAGAARRPPHDMPH